MNNFELSNYYTFSPLDGKETKKQQFFVFRSNGAFHQIQNDCLYYDFGIALIRNNHKVMSYITNCKQNIYFSASYYNCIDEYSFGSVTI